VVPDDSWLDLESRVTDTPAGPEGHIVVEFFVPESAISVLDGTAVCATTRDGVQAVGILTPFVPRDGTRTMVQIREVVSDELVLATDIRNLAEIVVP
jgi:hypothetical protein